MNGIVRTIGDTPDFRLFFESTFHALFENMHRYAYTIVKDNEQAKDIVQGVFTKWWEKRNELKIEGPVKSYLFTAVYNQSLNYLRNIKTRKTSVVDFGLTPFEKPEEIQPDTGYGKEMEIKLKKALEELPPQCKLIFIKSRFEEKKYAEIAHELNLSIKTVEAQIGKALKILRCKLLNKQKIATILLILHWIG